MPRKSQKAKLILDQEMKEQLQQNANSRTAPVREVQRANILLRYAEGMPIVDIERWYTSAGQRFTNGLTSRWLWESKRD